MNDNVFSSCLQGMHIIDAILPATEWKKERLKGKSQTNWLHNCRGDGAIILQLRICTEPSTIFKADKM